MSSSTSKRNTRNFKTIFLVIACIALASGVFVFTRSPKNLYTPHTTPAKTSQAPAEPYKAAFSSTLFVPYWLMDGTFEAPTNINNNITSLMYFGISPLKDGTINTDDDGYKKISQFRTAAAESSAKTYLTVRMMNESNTEAILSSKTFQDTLFSEVENASEGFDGIALDLEHSVIPTQETVDSISAFVARFASNTHSHNKKFDIIIYGDTYYRGRPYNLPKIAESVDVIHLMAYDFTKSFGQPGPNFPLYTRETYPYSLEMLVKDVEADVPIDKVSITFGLFGYDWAVDDQDRPLKRASSLTFSQIRSRFYEKCEFDHCTRKRDPISAEQKITYIEESQKHTVWFEDPLSMREKSEFLRTKGISHIGFWAHGYY